MYRSFFKKHRKLLVLSLFILIGIWGLLQEKTNENRLFFPLESIVQDEITFFSPFELKELIDVIRAIWQEEKNLIVFVVFDRMPKRLRTKWTSRDGQRYEKVRSAYSQIQKTWNLHHNRNVSFYCIERDTEEKVFRFYYGEHHFARMGKSKSWTFSIGTPVILSKEEIHSLISKEISQNKKIPKVNN